MSENTGAKDQKTPAAQDVLDALFGASLDAIQLLAAAVRGEAYGPQQQDLRQLNAKDQVDLARHLLIHAGPLTEQLRAASEEPSPGLH